MSFHDRPIGTLLPTAERRLGREANGLGELRCVISTVAAPLTKGVHTLFQRMCIARRRTFGVRLDPGHYSPIHRFPNPRKAEFCRSISVRLKDRRAAFDIVFC